MAEAAHKLIHSPEFSMVINTGQGLHIPQIFWMIFARLNQPARWPGEFMSEKLDLFLRKFRLPDISNVRIDETTSIYRKNRHSYIYRERNHYMIIGTELLSDNINIAIYADSIMTWQPPYQNEKLTQNDRMDILEKICKYFDRQKITYTVE